MNAPAANLRSACAKTPRRVWQLSSDTQTKLLLLAAFVLFLVYGSFRQRYIWGVDSFGYYQAGQLFSQGRVFLSLPLEVPHAAPLVPWGFKLEPGTAHALPEYPPGFPLLLAVGHLLGAPRWVTPFIGALSCALLYQLIRARARTSTALCLTAAWAVMPLTVYGATAIMSDLVASTALMGALLAFQRKRLALAAWIFAFAFAVRPTNAIVFLPFALLLLRPDGPSIRFLFHLVAPCALYGAYNFALYGAPWRTGYGNIWGQISAHVFPQFFGYFATITWTLLTPILLGFAVVALLRPTRERFFFLLWPLVLVVFYSFWSSGGSDKWWWARFITPGYPGLFLLAADGAEIVKKWAVARFARPAWTNAAIALTLASLPAFYLHFGRAQDDLWLRTTGLPNYELMQRVSAVVPPGSLVGTLEHASSVHLYTRLIPFVCVQPGASDLVDDALTQGRRVFYLPEPWHINQPVVAETMRRFAPREVARFNSPWPNLVLYELTRR